MAIMASCKHRKWKVVKKVYLQKDLFFTYQVCQMYLTLSYLELQLQFFCQHWLVRMSYIATIFYHPPFHIYWFISVLRKVPISVKVSNTDESIRLESLSVVVLAHFFPVILDQRMSLLKFNLQGCLLQYSIFFFFIGANDIRF